MKVKRRFEGLLVTAKERKRQIIAEGMKGDLGGFVLSTEGLNTSFDISGCRLRLCMSNAAPSSV